MSTPRLTVLALPLFVFAGCGGHPEQPQTPADPSEVSARLAMADAQDGTVDKVVSNCAGCKLHMAGKKEHAAAVGDYTLYFCEHCVDKVKNPVPAITQLKLDK
jgi:Fe-S oxidoreductase